MVRDSITLVGGGCVSTIVKVEMIVLVGGVTSVATTVSTFVGAALAEAVTVSITAVGEEVEPPSTFTTE